MAELWSIFIGIKLVFKLGFVKVEIESDSYRAIECIKEKNKKKKHLLVGNLVSSISRMLSQFEDLDLHHIYKEANKCANLLALEGKKLK